MTVVETITTEHTYTFDDSFIKDGLTPEEHLSQAIEAVGWDRLRWKGLESEPVLTFKNGEVV